MKSSGWHPVAKGKRGANKRMAYGRTAPPLIRIVQRKT